MEISIKGILLLTSTLITGLSAGFFYAWQVSVIPGTKQVDDQTYVHTMQEINRAIINFPFMLIFFGSLIFQVVSTILFRGNDIFWILLAALLSYFLGTILITAGGNVPLNNMLDAVNLKETDPQQLSGIRSQYQLKWNRLHATRTLFALLSFILLLIAAIKAH